ncbi:hypothetical protein A5630_11750 [Mycolicibacterium mucogenicum]|uniref:Uncharacterized protein n=1 Tax=Mycolicibacterium mucogenicum TaxID=56689 RepID=A0A1A3HE88_MYCMU|nr:hypothetical protein [Mycolicibacterium mucogenicum]OBJ46395.1 hypothetical protein A5630_11750 [Mycolicibacterium mucogenicum]
MTEFSICDLARNGLRAATVTDVGTVLVTISMGMSASRMVCPWELVRLRAAEVERGFGARWRWNN